VVEETEMCDAIYPDFIKLEEDSVHISVLVTLSETLF
jgi:hypothetical protein